jgi:ATP-binding cassette subfamily F protein 3
MRIGYCAQKRGRFPTGTTVLDAALGAGSPSRREIHSVLSRLRFAWDDLDRAVGSLSGGEWNRLQLGIAILAEANLLVLDEPTNHLDIPSREAVEEALTDFDGTIIAVSHDRYFLDAVAERIVELTDHRLVPYEGSFTRFWYERARPEPVRATGSGAAHRRTRTSARGGGAADIEQQIMQLEASRDELESRMNESFARGNYREGRRHGAELAKLRDRIEELYARWGT